MLAGRSARENGGRRGTNLDDRERERKRWRDKRGGSPRLWKLVWCSCGLRNRGESKELHSPVISLTHKLLAISRLCWSRVGNTRSTLPPRYVPTSLSSLPTLLRSGWSLKISASFKWQMRGARTRDLRIRQWQPIVTSWCSTSVCAYFLLIFFFILTFLLWLP